MKYLLKPKYHLIYAMLSQVIVIAVNLGTLISKNYKIDYRTVGYDLFLLVIPNLFYTILISAFYYIYMQNNKLKRRHHEKHDDILFYTIIFANIVYCVVIILNSNVGLYIFNLVIRAWNLFTVTKIIPINIMIASENTNGLYYIDTVIIQVINAFFASKYIISSAEPITTGKELVILKVFVYSAVITTLLSVYYCFDNIFMAWILIIISAILMFISYSIFHTHYMRKYLRRREEED